MDRTQAVGQQRTEAWTPGASQGLTVEIVASRLATMANGPARERFLIEIVAPSEASLPGLAASGPRTPLNLCLLIDRSGSMEGAPLDFAKQACSHVVDLLGPEDVLSIVAFDETVEVIMAPQRLTDRQRVKDGIALLAPGYTTNLSDGIVVARQELSQFIEQRRATRMVVLSDGEPTAGVQEFGPLVDLAGQTKAAGITMTFLGFGPDYNEELLAGMAKRAGGNYYYISEPHLIPEVFRAELQKLVSVSATQLKLTMRLSRWVELKGLSGEATVPDGREFSLDLPDLERGATMQQVVDLEFPNHPVGHYRVAGGRLEYGDVTGGDESVALDFVIEFTSDASRYSVPADPRVEQAHEVSAVSRAIERTVMGLKSNQVTQAIALADLQKTQAMLTSQGRLQEAAEVTQAIRAIQGGNVGVAEKTLMGTVVNLDQGKQSN
ncbi:MAG: VWA domain-containing protein [Fimbriimonadaceae bacterium]|nr:VWA domain-containing protein [Fimbriimonadaceae bacterium]